MQEFNVTHNEVPYILCVDFDEENGNIFDLAFYSGTDTLVPDADELHWELYALMEQEINEAVTGDTEDYKCLGYIYEY